MWRASSAGTRGAVSRVLSRVSRSGYPRQQVVERHPFTLRFERAAGGGPVVWVRGQVELALGVRKDDRPLVRPSVTMSRPAAACLWQTDQRLAHGRIGRAARCGPGNLRVRMAAVTSRPFARTVGPRASMSRPRATPATRASSSKSMPAESDSDSLRPGTWPPCSGIETEPIGQQSGRRAFSGTGRAVDRDNHVAHCTSGR